MFQKHSPPVATRGQQKLNMCSLKLMLDKKNTVTKTEWLFLLQVLFPHLHHSSVISWISVCSKNKSDHVFLAVNKSQQTDSSILSWDLLAVRKNIWRCRYVCWPDDRTNEPTVKHSGLEHGSDVCSLLCCCTLKIKYWKAGFGLSDNNNTGCRRLQQVTEG